MPKIWVDAIERKFWRFLNVDFQNRGSKIVYTVIWAACCSCVKSFHLFTCNFWILILMGCSQEKSTPMVFGQSYNFGAFLVSLLQMIHENIEYNDKWISTTNHSSTLVQTRSIATLRSIHTHAQYLSLLGPTYNSFSEHQNQFPTKSTPRQPLTFSPFTTEQKYHNVTPWPTSSETVFAFFDVNGKKLFQT